MKNAKIYERIVLKEPEVQKLDLWINQVREEWPGIPLNRSALVSWLVSSRESDLRPNEVKQIREMLFDDVKYLRWMVRELEDARKNGIEKSFEDLLPHKKPKQRRSDDEPTINSN